MAATTRTGYIGTEAVGDVLTKANFDKLPNGLVAYNAATANQTGISAVTDLTNLTITYTFPASRTYQVLVHIGLLIQNTSTGNIKVVVRDGASATQGVVLNTTVTATSRVSCEGSIFIQPSSGSATYKAALLTSAGTVDLNANASPGDPGQSFIWLIDLGPSF